MKKVYFVGVGGIGMAALARYYLSLGLPVAGYDRTPSALTAELAAEGVVVSYDDAAMYRSPFSVKTVSRCANAHGYSDR